MPLGARGRRLSPPGGVGPFAAGPREPHTRAGVGIRPTLYPSKLNGPMARAANGPLGPPGGHPGRRAWPPSESGDLGGRYRPSPRPEGPSSGAFGPQPPAPSYSIIQLNNLIFRPQRIFGFTEHRPVGFGHGALHLMRNRPINNPQSTPGVCASAVARAFN